MITEVHIQSFKAILDAKIDLTPMHLLIGPNDAGKTTVLEAIAALCRTVDHSLTDCFVGRWDGRDLVHAQSKEPVATVRVQLRNGHESMSYEFTAEFPEAGRKVSLRDASGQTAEGKWNTRYNTNYTLTFAADQGPGIAEAARTNPAWNFASQIQELLAGCWYIRWTARNLSLPTALDPKRKFRLESNGFGLPTLLDDLLSYDRRRFDQLESEFVAVFPNIKSVGLVQENGYRAPVDQADDTLQLQPSPGKQVVFRLKNSDRDLPASQAAEGMLYILAYLAVLYLPTPPRVLLIEEPENGIHPLRVGDVVKILRRIIQQHPETQIVLTSHSPYLVDAFEPEEVTWCRRDENGDVVLTRLDEVPEVKRSLDVFSLGEIWTGELDSVAVPTEVPE